MNIYFIIDIYILLANIICYIYVYFIIIIILCKKKSKNKIENDFNNEKKNRNI